MALSEVVIARTVLALKTDVKATLGGYESAVDHFVDLGRTFIDDDSWFTQWLVDEVQQYFHVTFVDTAWPACPQHPNHPLWFHDGAWWCGREPMATFGALSEKSGPKEKH
jgi:hypothetical protein